MGCRERTRGALNIPGSRPAGIYSAGTAQRYVNIDGYLPGKRVVILGSGDIGLIMARRMTLEGAKVLRVCELMPYSGGLPRNIAQCLDDFDIPLYLSTSVVRIDGKDRVEGVVAAPLNSDRTPDMSRSFSIPCDTVLFSVGLIPEMELARKLGIVENGATNGAMVDSTYMTSMQGIFSAGNMLHVHDLVDFVAEEAEYAAANMIDYLKRKEREEEFSAEAGNNLKYVVPSRFVQKKTARFLFRPTVVADKAVLKAIVNDNVLWEKKLSFVRPAEMIIAQIPENTLSGNVRFEFECLKNA
jgi:pyruvate/2-oxoglutarate dehydrogenase complex dihydrolipoamide dehydrogenase (E3) component